jgi:hypothetical protein
MTSRPARQRFDTHCHDAVASNTDVTDGVEARLRIDDPAAGDDDIQRRSHRLNGGDARGKAEDQDG